MNSATRWDGSKFSPKCASGSASNVARRWARHLAVERVEQRQHHRLPVARHADQIVRGTVVLPHGTGKKVRVLVIAQGDKAQEAIDALLALINDKFGEGE